jgi:tetratricopeptide (TPR) repeat protein
MTWAGHSRPRLRAVIGFVAVSCASAAWALSFGTAGPYEPERAARYGVDGKATLQCTEDPKGRFSDCSVVSETPTGFAFGFASLKMVKARALSLRPMAPGEQAREVRFDVPFTLPREMRDAVNQAYFEALDAMNQGRSADAIEALNGVIAKRPTFAPAWSARALALYRNGRPAEAMADLDKVLQLKTSYKPSMQAYMSGDKPLFDEMNVDFGLVLFMQAEIEAKRNDPDHAASSYQRALAEINAELRQYASGWGFTARALFEKGVIEHRLGDQAAGDADIAAALASDPKVADAMARLDIKP